VITRSQNSLSQQHREISHNMRSPVGQTEAILFYLVFMAGIVLFAVGPAMEAQRLNHARDTERCSDYYCLRRL
jgi:uncharacterized membrane protein